MTRSQIGHGEALQSAGLHHPAEGRPGEQDRGEERGQDAEHQRDGKSLDRAGRHLEKDPSRDQRGRIRVENRAERLAVGPLDGGTEGFASLQLLAETLVEEHVGIHRQADGQDDAGDTGEGEDEVPHRHHPEEQDDIDEQADEGNETREAVVEEDEEHHQGETGDA